MFEKSKFQREDLGVALRMWDGSEDLPAFTDHTRLDRKTSQAVTNEIHRIRRDFIASKPQPSGTVGQDAEWAMDQLLAQYPEISKTAQQILDWAYCFTNR